MTIHRSRTARRRVTAARARVGTAVTAGPIAAAPVAVVTRTRGDHPGDGAGGWAANPVDATTPNPQVSQSAPAVPGTDAPTTPNTPTRPPYVMPASPKPASAATTQRINGLFNPARPVKVDVTGFWSWSLLDRQSRKVVAGYQQSSTSTTASMIKSWIASDYLRRAAEANAQPPGDRLADLSIMIRDSDNDIAEDFFRELGGDASIKRLISKCGLTETSPVKGWWSNTTMSSQDAARMGACIADGRAAGSKWTWWVVNEMRQVRGMGTFGVRPQLPSDVVAQTAVKNGWIMRDEQKEWHVNCLADIGQRWVLTVMTRYDEKLGYGYGANICASVTRQLMGGAP